MLRAVADRMRDEMDTLAPLMTEEMGKPIKESLGEVTKAAWAAEHYAEHAEGYLAPLELELRRHPQLRPAPPARDRSSASSRGTRRSGWRSGSARRR